jgi:hypothetical protein
MPVCPGVEQRVRGWFKWSELIGAGSAAGSRPTPFLQSTRFAGLFRAGLTPPAPNISCSF